MNKTPHQIVPVILCGGSGTRLWPLSRAGFPKQFLVLSGTTSLFQQAIERVNGLAAEDIKVGDRALWDITKCRGKQHEDLDVIEEEHIYMVERN